VGTHKEIPVDVRVISATNQNIQKLLSEKGFRLDLYHRLNTFEINIPPLRERREDIPLLIEHYTAKISDHLKKKITSIDQDVIDMLVNYDFPGNVRELKNFIEKAVILTDDENIATDCFPDMKLKFTANQSNIPELHETSLDLEIMEKKMIITALEKAANNKTKAARLLNITRQALDRRIKKFELDEG